MPRRATELSALAVSKITEPGMHYVGGVPGLALQVLPSGARTWILRAMVGGKRREMGLGGYSQSGMTLAKAREAALEARGKIKQGIDPIEQAKAARSQLAAALSSALTFKQAAEKYIETHEAGWKNEKHGQQWRNTLATYAYPHFGALSVRDVALPHVMAALEPIWRTKTETASRVRNRIELVLDWATARNLRDDSNPARWRGHLDKLLPKPSKVAKVEHHRAISLDAIGAFMQRLRAMEGTGARALEFGILTAARSGEVRGALWSEIDLEAASWIIPASRMKAKKDHRVPLSPPAVKLLKALPRFDGDLVFPAPRGGQLSSSTLLAVMQRMEVDAVPHGFRSTFRDWASERTNYPHEMAEMALAHTIDDKTEAAYRRGDLYLKRCQMMKDWAAFIAKPQTTGAVVPLKKDRAARES